MSISYVGGRSSIAGSGRPAEDKYLLLTGATKAARAALGDAVLEGNLVEIKHVGSHTLNQVRAVKYIPLVIFHEPSSTWYVVPAHVVVLLVSKKNRGQHTENPFESATLDVRHLGAYQVKEAALKQRTLDAVAESANVPALRDEMVRVLARSKSLAAESLASVRNIAA